jgi:hypothetical protein
MGYSVTGNKNIGVVLKLHYERILYPLDIFEREEQKKAAAMKEEIVSWKTLYFGCPCALDSLYTGCPWNVYVSCP